MVDGLSAVADGTERVQLGHQSVHVGTVGKRETFEAKVVSTLLLEGSFGRMTLCQAGVGGNTVFWWWAGYAPALSQGDTVWITGTVKTHGEHNGEAQTGLTRVIVLREAPKPKPAKTRRCKATAAA